MPLILFGDVVLSEVLLMCTCNHTALILQMLMLLSFDQNCYLQVYRQRERGWTTSFVVPSNIFHAYKLYKLDSSNYSLY